MPKTKYEFTRNNNLRKEEGLEPLTWVDYIRDNPPKKLGRPRIEDHLKKPASRKSHFFLNFHPDEKKEPIARPPAIYDNTSYKSVYEKYGI